MNVYKVLKLALGNRIPRPLKMAGLWTMFLLRKRVCGVFIDPVLSCNLRCRMCYFSDPERRKTLHGVMPESEIDAVLNATLPAALKLQIGCGAEPTLYPRLPQIIRKGKEAGVPFISLTTNGMLIADGHVSLSELAAAGLHELTLSLHGTTPEIYEDLMPGAKYNLLKALAREIAVVKQKHSLSLRVNFTINSLNISDLKDDKFWDIWVEGGLPDIVQLRPVQKIGESSWSDFNLKPLIDDYDITIGAIAEECKKRGIHCIYPTKENILAVDYCQAGETALIEDLTYVYISPDNCYKDDFQPDKEGFHQYHRRKNSLIRIFRAIFINPVRRVKKRSKKLNYRID